MSTAFKVPPRQRNFDVHRFLSEGGTTREAAARFGVSQTRVRQLARRVVTWAAEVLPPETTAESAALARVAQSVAADRLEHFYQETMEQWRKTHQPKFLNLAIRVTMASVNLPGRAYEIGAAEADLLEPEEEESEEQSVGCDQLAKRAPAHRAPASQHGGPAAVAALSHPTVAPPARDCSLDKREAASPPKATAVSRDPSPRPASKLGLLLAGDVCGAEPIESRVRTLLSPSGQSVTAGVSATPESLGLSVEDTLRRFERRKRKAK